MLRLARTLHAASRCLQRVAPFTPLPSFHKRLNVPSSREAFASFLRANNSSTIAAKEMVAKTEPSEATLEAHPELEGTGNDLDIHHAVVSSFDLFSIGIGPSSSHTVGPMRAAKIFVNDLKAHGMLYKVVTLRVDLFGSLALTGRGHGTPNAVLMGLEGETPENVDINSIGPRVEAIRSKERLALEGTHVIKFLLAKHLIFHNDMSLPQHPNGMRFIAFDQDGDLLATNEYFSIGGGFVVNNETRVRQGENLYYKEYDRAAVAQSRAAQNAVATKVALPFRNAAELLTLCERERMTVAQVVYENELRWHNREEIRRWVAQIWRVMEDSIRNGCLSESEWLPGKLRVRRRAPALFRKLARSICTKPISLTGDALIRRDALPDNSLPRRSQRHLSLPALDYLTVYAIAVNEENAAGGRVVTAPTNGAAGVIPAVLKYFIDFISMDPERDVAEFLFTSAAIGMLYKRGASISAAEMGCQGEVGVACSMAAAGFAAVMGGTAEQVENAAEIGMEHNLGLTCDPVEGLVQIPCIERNALGAVKAVTAAQLALNEDGLHRVTLDQVIETMRQTGHDMVTKYKETSQGGLAVTVNVPIC